MTTNNIIKKSKQLIKKYGNIDKIHDDMNQNRNKIKQIHILISKFKLKDIDEQDLEVFKNHVLWCHKEILELYDNYERLLKATKLFEKKEKK